MARGATIYRAIIELSNVDRDRYAELAVTVAQHPSETRERMVVRLLAYALRFEEGLEFGRGVSATDEPDAWSRHGDGRVRQWIEVGQPDPKRLVKAARRSETVTAFAFGAGVERWREALLAKIDPPANLGVCGLDSGFIDRASDRLDRTIRWSLTQSEGCLFLGIGADTFETTPHPWVGSPLA